MSGYIHHLQWSVASRDQMVSRLAETWGAEVVAGRELESVLRLGSTLILLSEKQQEPLSWSPSLSYPYLQCCQGKVCPHTQSVFNICLEVEDVPGTVDRMEREGSRLVMAPHSITSSLGRVDCAVVSSPCENVLHSLVNTRQYRGVFLPGFSPVTAPSLSSSLSPSLKQLDHLTYVCRAGQSQEILEWYRNTCGMQTFLINPSQASDVVDVEGEAGLRLRVGEWLGEWLCREVGGEIPPPSPPTSTTSSHHQMNNFKLVLAEPLGEGGHVNRRVVTSKPPTVPTTNVPSQVPAAKSRPRGSTYRPLHRRHSAGRLCPLREGSGVQETSYCLLQSGNTGDRIGQTLLQSKSFISIGRI